MDQLHQFRVDDPSGRTPTTVVSIDLASSRALAHGSLADANPKLVYSPKQQTYTQITEILVSDNTGAATTVDLHVVPPGGPVAGNVNRVRAGITVDGPIEQYLTLIEPEWEVYLSSAAGPAINYHISGIELTR